MSVVRTEEGSSSLSFSTKNVQAEFKVDYKFDTGNGNDANLLHQVVNSSLFSDYLGLYTKLKSLKLNRVTFKEIKMCGDEVEQLRLCVDVEDKDGCVVEDYPVTLSGSSMAILILMRVGDSPKDMCVFLKQCRPNMAAPDFLELPEGKFDENGKFVGEAAMMITESLEISINKNNLINLTELAFGTDSPGISTCKNSDNRFTLYLHRCNVTAAKIAEFEEKCHKKKSVGTSDDKTASTVLNGEVKKHDGMQLRLVPLGDAWRSTTDCKAINAIFLVHELRYHGLMPKFRSENGYGMGGKKSAQFIKIGALEPMSTGINLRVKVSKPVTMLPERARHDGKSVKEGTMVVGDDDGIITLKLSQEQLSVKDEIGIPMIIRNAKIQMENGHMMLSVDRWGKIDTTIPEGEENCFDFIVNEENDVSSTEFELVVLDNEESENNNTSPEHTSTATGRNRSSGSGSGKYSGGRRSGGGMRNMRVGRGPRTGGDRTRQGGMRSRAGRVGRQ